MKNWFKSGSPWIWLSAATVSISLIMVVGLIGLIAVRGLSMYWPGQIHQMDLRTSDGKTDTVIGEVFDSEQVSKERLKDAGVIIETDKMLITRYLVKTGNRDVDAPDFRWLIADNVVGETFPKEIVVFERMEWGNLYGFIESVKEDGNLVAESTAVWPAFNERLARATKLQEDITSIEKHEIGSVNYEMERLRLKQRKLELKNKFDARAKQEIENEKTILDARYKSFQSKLASLYQQIKRDTIQVKISTGAVVDVQVGSIVRAFKPNAMGTFDKVIFYVKSIWLFVSEDPREANTEGGIFPAIFGTVMMVLIMSVIVTPFGIMAAVYLREYAKQGVVTRTIRIAVNNLAGVPSIVYGVFGLGFFVYFLGGNIDQLFFAESLPAPTFGTPGIIWASLTLAILTVPVVIVATEEGLSRVPISIRQGSLALGATKWETLWKTVLPMASPAMMTGLILAVARAAGEVAPLMLVGVVKLAPSLPLDGDFPFLHLDRKFMHLGFHIFDVGFQSPNVEAARPLVYSTAFLLVCVIIVLNLTAIAIRNRLREKYKGLDH
ncbi:MAG: phosphate ABC transporter permease PstA [Gammaproteobacteria bacterium]|nr:phosphate ABC transporter permease PstA [Gammaproteobacteria bacterium]